jgi:hypothetical protein
MARAKKAPTLPRRCIFCGGTGVSGEHLFSAWISKIVPGVVERHTKTLGHPGQDPVKSLRVEGDILSKKIKAVCASCNGGWMKRQEDAVIPLLTPLILGERSVLTPQDQRIIHIWATMKALVGEMDDPDRRRIPPNSAAQPLVKMPWPDAYDPSEARAGIRSPRAVGRSNRRLRSSADPSL